MNLKVILNIQLIIHDYSDMTRSAVVLAVAAMDSYFTDVFVERLIVYIKSHKPNTKLVELLSKAGVNTNCTLHQETCKVHTVINPIIWRDFLGEYRRFSAVSMSESPGFLRNHRMTRAKFVSLAKTLPNPERFRTWRFSSHQRSLTEVQ